MTDLKNNYVEIKVDTEMTALVVRFLGFVPFEDFKSIIQQEFDLIEKYRLRKVLIDLRLLPVYAVGSKEYVRDVWFPTAERLGVKAVAFAQPTTVLAQMAMQKAHEDARQTKPMKVEHFDSPEKAKAWLQSQA